MKSKRFIVLFTVFTSISAFILISKFDFESKNGSYFQKELSGFMSQTGGNEAQEWLRARYIDVTTGQTVTNERLAEIDKQIRKISKSKSISFIEQGPDNIGGRTRAVLVNRNNVNEVWAGSVSGGLFYSANKGSTWTRVDSYAAALASPNISSMTQTTDGTLYVATGSNQESWSGNGVWYSTDNGATWQKVPGTTECTEIVSASESSAIPYAWLATSAGLKKWKVGDAGLTGATVTTGACTALKISPDGNVIVAAFGSSKTYVSNDAGLTFADKSGNSTGTTTVPVGAARIEYAISSMKNSSNKYSIYAVRTNGELLGMNVSHDDGQTWSQFVGASSIDSDLNIYSNGVTNQGTYNSVVSVVPNDPEKILIGGIDIWKWKQTINNPPFGGFEQISLGFASPASGLYVHSDNHEMKWDNNNRLYIGNDGGIGISQDYGQSFYASNRGYNVTQFYGIAFDRDGSVMGGTQDNGTLYNNHANNTYQEFREVLGGDGFECEISFFNPKVMFGSIYNNALYRSSDKGQTWNPYSPSLPASYNPTGTVGSAEHPFHTEIFLAEYYDLNSQDSVTFIPKKNYASGASIRVSSAASGDTMTFVTPTALYFDDTLFYTPSLTSNGVNYGQNTATGETIAMGTQTVIYNVSWDTLRVQDPYQSWFVFYVNKNGGEIWGSRNSLRLSATNGQWVCVARNIGSDGKFDIEFSRDLNQLYIGTSSGVTRVNGLGSIYTSDPAFSTKVGYGLIAGGLVPTHTTNVKITSTSYEGIAVNPNDPADLVLFASFGGTNKRCTNANTATSSNLVTVSLPTIVPGGIACYDGIIDRNDPNIIVVGTAKGVFVTENGGATWDNASTGFDGTPVYEVRQSWRSFDEGNGRPGEIYIGTYGRGIFSSSAYLDLNENNNSSIYNENFRTKLKAYPNPSTDNTTLSFDLAQTGGVSVQVYSITGRLVKSINNKNMLKGDNTLSLDCDDLPNGTYIVKFVSGKQNETVKFIKM